MKTALSTVHELADGNLRRYVRQLDEIEKLHRAMGGYERDIQTLKQAIDTYREFSILLDSYLLIERGQIIAAYERGSLNYANYLLHLTPEKTSTQYFNENYTEYYKNSNYENRYTNEPNR